MILSFENLIKSFVQSTELQHSLKFFIHLLRDLDPFAVT